MQAFHPEHKIFVNGLNYFVHLPPRSHGMMSDTLSLKNLSAICTNKNTIVQTTYQDF